MEIINYFPGRVRIKTNSLYKNNELSQIAEMYLNELEGVQKSQGQSCPGHNNIGF